MQSFWLSEVCYVRMGFLTRDSRKVERKKYGQPGARKIPIINVNQVREWRLLEGRGWDIREYNPVHALSISIHSLT